MKKNNLVKSIMFIIVFLMVTLTTIPAFAASATVDVKFIVKNQQGPYRKVGIKFGQNNKMTRNDGTAEFRLKNIPVTTMVSAQLIDPQVPSGYFCDVNLALGAHEDVKVNSTSPGQGSLNITFTENTKTIVIEYFVDNNFNYGYSNATFKHKLIGSKSKPAPATPKPPSNPQPKGDPNSPPQDGFDPDMMPEENHEEFNPEHFEDMPNEEFNEEFNPENFEQMPPEENLEGISRNEFDRKPNNGQAMPSYVWIIVGVGALVVLIMIILIIVMIRKK